MSDLINENERLKKEFYKTKDSYILEQYVVSELQPPICDYENALSIIYRFGQSAMGNRLSIIGGYIEYMWTIDNDSCIAYLNEKIDSLDCLEKATLYYLNALMIEKGSPNFREDATYKNWLEKSISCPVKFVNNRIRLARLLAGKKKESMYQEAMQNIEEVHSFAEIRNNTLEHYLNPDVYIQEMILGTHISYVNFMSIKEELESI